MPVAIAIPASIPPALSRMRAQFVDSAETVAKDQGELRRLPRFASVPQKAAVQWYLNQEQFDDFWDWHEDTLQAGARRFDLQLERQGGPGEGANDRLSWHTAQFVGEPYTAEVSETGDCYTVAATLLLIGDPFDTRIAPGFLAGGVDGDVGGAVFTAPAIFAGDTDGDIGGAFFRLGAVLASDTDEDDGGAFMGDNDSAYLREDSGYILREDGGRILRE